MAFQFALMCGAVSFVMSSVSAMFADFKNDRPAAVREFRRWNIGALFSALLVVVVHGVAVICNSAALLQVSYTLMSFASNIKFVSVFLLLWTGVPTPTDEKRAVCCMLFAVISGLLHVATVMPRGKAD